MMQHPLITDQRGEGLIGFLVSVVISAIVFAATTTAYLQGIVRAQDHRTMVQVREEAREIADLIASELRLLGSGMPLSQDDFSSSDLSLGDAPLPLLLDSSASYIHFRLNEFGRGAIIDAAFDPISTSTISVTDSSIFAVGDTVYLTNMTTGGTDGLQGGIVSISGNSITLNGTMLYPVGATFDVGSLVEPVSTIAFNSPETWSGITRDSGSGEITIAPNSIVEFEYRNSSGTALPLALTASVVDDDLASVWLQVTVRSQRPLSNGEVYEATAEHTVALRNLVISG